MQEVNFMYAFLRRTTALIGWCVSAQDFGCSRDDFNCQCPQVVNPATGQPVPQPPEPVCGGPPTAATAAGQALGGAKAAVPTSSAKAPAPAPLTAPSKAGTPVPAPAASNVTGAAAAKPPAVAPASARLARLFWRRALRPWRPKGKSRRPGSALPRAPPVEPLAVARSHQSQLRQPLLQMLPQALQRIRTPHSR